MTELTKPQIAEKTTREHSFNVFVTLELKERIQALAKKYDRTNADIIRAILRIGIPMMEGMSKAEETMVKEYVQLFRRLRQVRSLRDI